MTLHPRVQQTCLAAHVSASRLVHPMARGLRHDVVVSAPCDWLPSSHESLLLGRTVMPTTSPNTGPNPTMQQPPDSTSMAQPLRRRDRVEHACISNPPGGLTTLPHAPGVEVTPFRTQQSFLLGPTSSVSVVGHRHQRLPHGLSFPDDRLLLAGAGSADRIAHRGLSSGQGATVGSQSSSRRDERSL